MSSLQNGNESGSESSPEQRSQNLNDSHLSVAPKAKVEREPLIPNGVAGSEQSWMAIVIAAEDERKKESAWSPPPILPASTYGIDVHEWGSNSGFEEAFCTICFDDFSDDVQFAQTPCKHVFHVDCIEKWLSSVSFLCPICRYLMSSKDNAA